MIDDGECDRKLTRPCEEVDRLNRDYVNLKVVLLDTERQRDTLLAALKWVLSPYCTRLVDARERIRTAICEVQGEK